MWVHSHFQSSSKLEKDYQDGKNLNWIQPDLLWSNMSFPACEIYTPQIDISFLSQGVNLKIAFNSLIFFALVWLGLTGNVKNLST